MRGIEEEGHPHASPSLRRFAGHLCHSLACKRPPDLCLHLCMMFPFLYIRLPTSFITITTLEQGRASGAAFAATLFPNKVRSEVLRVEASNM